ncbi:hypothetical protein M758_10G065800 [Ceratodon purpureus]|nr:hypothetical protein M758_10G065800 [Ceratodon purpureus]
MYVLVSYSLTRRCCFLGKALAISYFILPIIAKLGFGSLSIGEATFSEGCFHVLSLQVMCNDGDKAFGTAADLCIQERTNIALEGIVIARYDCQGVLQTIHCISVDKIFTCVMKYVGTRFVLQQFFLEMSTKIQVDVKVIRAEEKAFKEGKVEADKLLRDDDDEVVKFALQGRICITSRC